MMVASEITCHEPANAAFAILRNGARARHSGRSLRDINEDARDYARSLKDTPEFEQSSDERKKVEMRLACVSAKATLLASFLLTSDRRVAH
jgi:hypothetical protein